LCKIKRNNGGKIMDISKIIKIGNQYANLSITVSISILLIIIIQTIIYLAFNYIAIKFLLPLIVMLPVALIIGSINFKRLIKET